MREKGRESLRERESREREKERGGGRGGEEKKEREKKSWQDVEKWEPSAFVAAL